MPQMSPMLWSLLFIYFILLFIFFNVMNYFNFVPSSITLSKDDPSNKSMLNTNKNFLIWKW